MTLIIPDGGQHQIGNIAAGYTIGIEPESKNASLDGIADGQEVAVVSQEESAVLCAAEGSGVYPIIEVYKLPFVGVYRVVPAVIKEVYAEAGRGILGRIEAMPGAIEKVVRVGGACVGCVVADAELPVVVNAQPCK